MEERRREQRWRTLLAGQLAFHDRCARVECVVRNTSSNGAKLILERSALIPDAFDLTLDQTGEHRRARLVWRSEIEVGVSFCESASATVISIDAARRGKTTKVLRHPSARPGAEPDDPA